jgi:hypothetical protein
MGNVDRCLHWCFLERILMFTLEEALTIMAAPKEAIETKQPMNIAVVD